MQTTVPRTQVFVNPEKLLQTIPVEPGMNIADFGCGNGHYTVAAAGMAGAKGAVYALDILEEALAQTATHAKLLGLFNVTTKLCDLEKFGSCPVPDITCDLVILGSLLHIIKDRDSVLRAAYRVLRTGGKLLVVEWLPGSFFGPPPSLRLPKEDVQALVEKSGFRPVRELPAGSFHYAFLYQK